MTDNNTNELNNNNEPLTTPAPTPTGKKRGRKSKKELLAALNLTSTTETVSEPVTTVEADKEDSVPTTTPSAPTPSGKKRGRKPKGGKIIQQVETTIVETEMKPNVILHLKCFMKDLENHNSGEDNVKAYDNQSDLSYDLLLNHENNTFNNNSTYFYLNNSNSNNNVNSISFSKKNKQQLENNYDNEYDNDYCQDDVKEVWRKLKQLEHNLHHNNISDKKSACFWCTCDFDNPPIYIPRCFMNGSYQVYGCFCSPECATAHLMEENIDSSTKFERYHLLNHIYSKIYNYKKNIKPAPNPYYMLEKFYGNLSIQEYRALLQNERLFLIVDKPLTRVLPELHEDNDEFILNNKIIPSNNYQIKKRLQRKPQNKSSAVNEKFGLLTT